MFFSNQIPSLFHAMFKDPQSLRARPCKSDSYSPQRKSKPGSFNWLARIMGYGVFSCWTWASDIPTLYHIQFFIIILLQISHNSLYFIKMGIYCPCFSSEYY